MLNRIATFACVATLAACATDDAILVRGQGYRALTLESPGRYCDGSLCVDIEIDRTDNGAIRTLTLRTEQFAPRIVTFSEALPDTCAVDALDSAHFGHVAITRNRRTRLEPYYTLELSLVRANACPYTHVLVDIDDEVVDIIPDHEDWN